MNSQTELVRHLMRTGILYTPLLIEAFLKTDRIGFVTDAHAVEAYEDYPLPIGYGQTISQPYTVAFMLEALQLQEEDHVLDIGSGSGWTTALIARCTAEVVGTERVEALVEFSRKNLKNAGIVNATVEQAGEKLGKPGHLFNKILVSAAADTFPSSLLDQLDHNGKLVIPVQHSIMVVTKDSTGRISQQVHPGYVFVPLIFSE